MNSNELHPKLKIAVDRLQKRYSNLRIEPHKGGNPAVYKTKDGTMSNEEVYTMVDVYADTSRIEFAHMYVSKFRHDDFDEQEFYLKSRLVDNQRYPRDEKKTIKEKIISKLVDEFAKPYTLEEESQRIFKKGKAIFENRAYNINWERRQVAENLAKTHGSVIANMLLGNTVAIPDEAKKKAQEYIEKTEKLEELGMYDNKKAVQVIAFEMHDRWVVNIYNAPTGDKCITYENFEDMPHAIKEKVALLKLASEDEILENIGVKVETQSYFLYGKELDTIS